VFPDGGPGGVEYCITLSNDPQHLSQFLTATQPSAKTVPFIPRVKFGRLGSQELFEGLNRLAGAGGELSSMGVAPLKRIQDTEFF
jgi:hypothetical protein